MDPRKHNRDNIVKMPKFYSFVGFVSIIFFAICCILIILFANETVTLPVMIGLSLFGGLDIIIVVQCLNWKVVYTDFEFSYRTFFRKTYIFKYSEIKQIKLNEDKNSSYILTTEKKKLYIYPYASGVKEFLKVLESAIENYPINEFHNTGILKPPKINLIIGLIFLIIPAIVEIPVVLFLSYDYILLISISLGGFFLLGLYILLYYLNWKIKIYDDYFKYSNVFGKTYKILYSNIKKINYCNNSNGNHVIKTHKKKINIDINIQSAKEFLEFVKEKRHNI